MRSHRLYTLLAYAGAIPFAVCAALRWAGYHGIPGFGSAREIAASYGLAIASFLAGAHWGTYLFRRAESPANLFLTSNMIVLAVWFAFLLDAASITLFVMILAFLYLLFVDYRLEKGGVVAREYLRMRVIATAVVVISLVALIASPAP